MCGREQQDFSFDTEMMATVICQLNGTQFDLIDTVQGCRVELALAAPQLSMIDLRP